MKHCHATGAVNGRLRAEQVLLDGQAKLRLLGFARRGPAVDRPRPLSHSFSLLDAPELHGRATASNAELACADVWALGILLSALMVGMPPFAAANADTCAPFAAYAAACTEAASGGGEWGRVTSLFGAALGTAAPELAAAVPPALLELMAAMLSPEPSRRPRRKTSACSCSVERAGWARRHSATVAVAAGVGATAAASVVGVVVAVFVTAAAVVNGVACGAADADSTSRWTRRGPHGGWRGVVPLQPASRTGSGAVASVRGWQRSGSQALAAAADGDAVRGPGKARREGMSQRAGWRQQWRRPRLRRWAGTVSAPPQRHGPAPPRTCSGVDAAAAARRCGALARQPLRLHVHLRPAPR